MFTGIIKNYLPVVEIEKKSGLITFSLQVSDDFLVGLKTGASVANDGVCLTVTKIDGDRIWFDVMEETLRLTTLGSLKVGDKVNVERSATFGDEIGGHIVSGHVTGMVEIVSVEKSENNVGMTFKVKPELMAYIFSKGFTALDGASLTVVDADKVAGTFKVWFIPETLKLTRFGVKGIGDKVNLEIDSRTQAIVETVKVYLKENKDLL